MLNAKCPHCGQPMPPEMAEAPHTQARPSVVKVFIREKARPVRSVAVVQVVDFYRGAPCSS